MCLAAARPALEAARLTAHGPGRGHRGQLHRRPAPALHLGHREERPRCHRALALDVAQAACASGVHAVLLAAHLLQNPSISTVLVIGADCASRVIRPTDRTGGVFFGDAAAAVVLTRAETAGAGLLSYDIGSKLSYAVQIPGGGSRLPTTADTVAAGAHYVSMDGPAVWETATTRLPESVTSATRKAGLTPNGDRPLLLPPGQHQHPPGDPAAAWTSRPTGPPSRSTGSATRARPACSPPFTTPDRASSQPGDTYVMSAIGAGFHWGTLCLRQA